MAIFLYLLGPVQSQTPGYHTITRTWPVELIGSLPLWLHKVGDMWLSNNPWTGTFASGDRGHTLDACRQRQGQGENRSVIGREGDCGYILVTDSRAGVCIGQCCVCRWAERGERLRGVVWLLQGFLRLISRPPLSRFECPMNYFKSTSWANGFDLVRWLWRHSRCSMGCGVNWCCKGHFVLLLYYIYKHSNKSMIRTCVKLITSLGDKVILIFMRYNNM